MATRVFLDLRLAVLFVYGLAVRDTTIQYGNRSFFAGIYIVLHLSQS